MFTEMFSNAGIVAKLSVLAVFAPLVMGVIYAIRPTEARLMLMRPLSLVGIFSALSGFCVGVMNVLVGVSRDGWADPNAPIGLAEAMVPLFIGFGCLTVAWLCVALGLRRQPA